MCNLCFDSSACWALIYDFGICHAEWCFVLKALFCFCFKVVNTGDRMREWWVKCTWCWWLLPVGSDGHNEFIIFAWTNWQLVKLLLLVLDNMICFNTPRKDTNYFPYFPCEGSSLDYGSLKHYLETHPYGSYTWYSVIVLLSKHLFISGLNINEMNVCDK